MHMENIGSALMMIYDELKKDKASKKLIAQIDKALMMIYDELKKDKASKKLIAQIDKAGDDNTVKKGIVSAVARLRELGKNALADDIIKKTKGYAF